ncbi:MAG TPA: DMT family transporter, partial [Candidatus Krumholzibacteria bacterium]|nr:DMT family transporter [Candidatus Krumholzibacteria bacterium]
MNLLTPSRTVVVAAYLGACLIWGSTWMAIKVGLRGAPPLTSIAVRMTLAAAIVFVILRVRGIGLPAERRFFRVGVFLGFFHIVLPYTLVYYGEQHISSGLAAVLYAAMPLVVALIARVTMNERLTPRKIAGIAAGMLGVAVIFSDSLHVGRAQALGAAAVTGSMLAASVGSVATKRWAHGYHPVASLLVPFSTGATVTWLLALALEAPGSLRFDAVTWATIVYLAVAGSVTAFALFFFVMQHLSVTVVSYQTFIIPIIAVLVGWAVLGETISARVAVGAVMILAGVSLAIFSPRVRLRREVAGLPPA